MKLYHCLRCNQVFIGLFDSKTSMTCCGQNLEELQITSTEEQEMHQPIIRQVGNFFTVTIGNQDHPMLEVHQVKFILIKTNQGIQYKLLETGKKPQVTFILDYDEMVEEIYAYCNLGGLIHLAL